MRPFLGNQLDVVRRSLAVACLSIDPAERPSRVSSLWSKAARKITPLPINSGLLADQHRVPERVTGHPRVLSGDMVRLEPEGPLVTRP